MTELLERLLTAWRARRSKELADAMLSLDGPLVIEHVDDLEAMLKRAPDPRLSAGVAAVIADLRPARSLEEGDTHALWLRCAEVVERLDDPALIALRDEPIPWNSDWNVGGLTLRLDVAIGALERAYPQGAPSLSSEHEALVEEARGLRSSPGEEAERELLQAIYDAPDQDGPRIIYADWLAQRSDPRAELIQLQLRSDLDERGQARLRALTADAPWGPLAPIVVDGSLRRGFLSKAAIAWMHRGNIARLGADAAWATVEHVTFVGTRMPQHLDPSVTRSLRRVDQLDESGIEVLCTSAAPWAIRALSLKEVRLAAARRLLSEARLLPELREITLRPVSRRELWTMQREASRSYALEHLALEPAGLSIRMSRGPEQRFTHTFVRGYPEYVLELIETAPDYAFTHLEIESDLDEAQMLRLDDAAARQRGLDDIRVEGDIPT